MLVIFPVSVGPLSKSLDNGWALKNVLKIGISVDIP
jgi:hypothetical protein